MDPDLTPEEELQRREQELQEREFSLRLRELESEVNKPAQSVKPAKNKGAVRPWYRPWFKVGKFFVLVVVAAVAIKIAAGLAGVLILLAIFWAAYKVFF